MSCSTTRPAYRVTPGAVSHVSWAVPDLAQESTRLARLGCQLINTARSGPISVAWHDGGPLFPPQSSCTSTTTSSSACTTAWSRCATACPFRQVRWLINIPASWRDAAGAGPGTRVLDVGCGSGLTLVLAAQRGATPGGLDISPGLLGLARERLP